MNLRRPVLLLLALAPVAACDDPGPAARPCETGDDCASGRCLSNGTCLPLRDLADAGSDAAGQGDTPDTGTAGGDARAPDTPPEDDAGTDAPGEDAGLRDADDAPDPGPGCRPDGDGTVDTDELPVVPGLVARFRVTRGADGFSTAPRCDDDGACAWDLVEVRGETTDEDAETAVLAGRWYADEPAFAGATAVTDMGEFELSFFVEICRQRQEGVVARRDDGLYLLGLVSATEDGGTRLVYDPPVPLVRLPLALGGSWRVDTTATGPLCGSWVDYDIAQTWESEVDAAGALRTPYGDFPRVLRVNTRVDRHLGVGVLPTVMRTHAFVAECFGTVATVTSAEGVDTAEFDGAALVRRLAGEP